MGKLAVLLQEEQIRLKTKSQELESRISAAKAELLSVNERLRYVNGLLGPSNATENDSSEDFQPRNRDILNIAADILGERQGKPMHYKELAEEIQARGGNVPGVNAANTLVARFVKDERFVRPVQRGYYALSTDYPDVRSVGTRRRRENSNSKKDKKGVNASADLPK